MEDPASDPYADAKPSKFRLKTKQRSKRRRGEDEYEGSRSHKRQRSEDNGPRESRHASSRRRKKRSLGGAADNHKFNRSGDYDDPDHRYRESVYDDLDAEGLKFFESDGFDPDQAFQESLFDALADDEGAAYWEGVYGQPVHVYSNTKKTPDGKLERMSDEEYAEYVRAKMWEKSHQYIVEEREAREKARKQDKKRKRQLDKEHTKEEDEREHIRRRMEESLRQGEERRKSKEAEVEAREKEASWVRYVQKWEDLKTRKHISEKALQARELIPWPVFSGRWRHVSREKIEQFFKQSSAWKDDATALLKLERVRWHPDKMQQRFGQHIDQETMKSVTAVFQVVDRLWNGKR